MMKNIIYLCLVLVVLSGFAACSLENSNNGKLDGYWHLEQIDTMSTGGVNDLSGQKLFWAVQAKLLMLTDRNGRNTQIFMRFNHTGERLNLSEPHIDNRGKGDELLSDTVLLAPYGINIVPEDFKVERLTGSDMVLSTDRLRLQLKKF